MGQPRPSSQPPKQTPHVVCRLPESWSVPGPYPADTATGEQRAPIVATTVPLHQAWRWPARGASSHGGLLPDPVPHQLRSGVQLSSQPMAPPASTPRPSNRSRHGAAPDPVVRAASLPTERERPPRAVPRRSTPPIHPDAHHIWAALRTGSWLDFNRTRAFTLLVPSLGFPTGHGCQARAGEVLMDLIALLRSARRWLSSLRPGDLVQGESPPGRRSPHQMWLGPGGFLRDAPSGLPAPSPADSSR